MKLHCILTFDHSCRGFAVALTASAKLRQITPKKPTTPFARYVCAEMLRKYLIWPPLVSPPIGLSSSSCTQKPAYARSDRQARQGKVRQGWLYYMSIRGI